MKLSLIGGGSWGTSIARLLNNKGYQLNFYVRDSLLVKEINEKGQNSKYLPNIDLMGLKASSNLKESVENSNIIIIGVPSHAFRETLNSIKDYVSKNAIIVSLAKGIEVDSLMRMSEITKSILPNNDFVSLSGPSHAEEVAKDIPTAVTVSSKNEKASKVIQDLFSTDNFRVYTNNDLVGVEVGGALKNIIALAAGMSDGLNYGDNTKAALVTRGLYEMNKLSIALGANPHTLNGLSGIGDLIVTCTSVHSRNRKAGILIGKGYNTKEASELVGQVVEGIKTTKSAYELSKIYKVQMPITEKLYNVLYNGADPELAVKDLMTRKYKEEIEEIFFN